MKNIFILITFLLIPSFCFAQNVDLMWKARALQASDNLKLLKSEIKNKDSVETKLKIMLESAYGLIIVQPDIAVKKTNVIIAYHLIMNFGDDGMLDVAYIYDTSYNYIGARVDRLPKKRSIQFLEKKSVDDLFMIMNVEDNKEPMIAFSKSNPLEARVISNK